MKKEESVRTTVHIPASLYRRLEEQAAARGSSVRELVLAGVKGFFVCTALCPQSTGTTAASQTITAAPPNGGSFSLSANGIAYKCGGITITGQ